MQQQQQPLGKKPTNPLTEEVEPGARMRAGFYLYADRPDDEAYALFEVAARREARDGEVLINTTKVAS